MLRLRAVVFMVAAVLVATLAWADPQFPALTSPVVDAAHVIDDTARVIIENRIRDYKSSSGHQLQVATVPTLQGYDIRDFGYQLGRAWGIGDKKANDGVLILLAPTEHKVSIETGYGVEGDLTDAMSRIIIENAMVPRFKAGDYAGGVNAGIDDIIKVLGGQGDAVVQRVQNQSAPQAQDILPFVIIFIFIVIILVNASRGGRMLIVPGGGFGRGGFGGGGGFSGGGSWSGGGGSFGGGGASGGW